MVRGRTTDGGCSPTRPLGPAGHIKGLLPEWVAMARWYVLVNHPGMRLVADRDPPSIRALAGEEAETPRSLAQAQAEVTRPARHDTQKTAHHGPPE
jgi:hypothetical protein